MSGKDFTLNQYATQCIKVSTLYILIFFQTFMGFMFHPRYWFLKTVGMLNYLTIHQAFFLIQSLWFILADTFIIEFFLSIEFNFQFNWNKFLKCIFKNGIKENNINDDSSKNAINV